MKKYIYETNCVNSNYEDITNMVDNSKEIKYSTFIKHVSIKDIYEVLPMYQKEFPIKKDYHVRYFKSKFQGKKCYFIIQSAIEYIFI